MFARSLVRLFRSLSVAAVVSASLPAFAQEAPAPAAPVVTTSPAPAAAEVTRQTYPMGLLDRPLLLPRFVFQPTVDVGITNAAEGTGEALGIGLDVGLARRLQLGLFFELPVGPAADFGLFALNLQTSLGHAANLRFDVGAQRASVHGNNGASLTDDGFAFGVGVPIKARINRWLAFVSGSNAARGFGGMPVINVNNNGMIYGASAPFNDDLFSLAVLPGTGSPSFLPSTTVAGSLFLPVGLAVQPHERISLAVRTGYRLTFEHTVQDGPVRDNLVHFVPLAFDVVVSPIRQLDIGFTAMIYGYVADNMERAAGTPAAPGWADMRQFNIWIGGRI